MPRKTKKNRKLGAYCNDLNDHFWHEDWKEMQRFL
jgi:hypothetical protein